MHSNASVCLVFLGCIPSLSVRTDDALEVKHKYNLCNLSNTLNLTSLVVIVSIRASHWKTTRTRTSAGLMHLEAFFPHSQSVDGVFRGLDQVLKPSQRLLTAHANNRGGNSPAHIECKCPQRCFYITNRGIKEGELSLQEH